MSEDNFIASSPLQNIQQRLNLWSQSAKLALKAGRRLVQYD